MAQSPISTTLESKHIKPHLDGDDKDSIIREMVELLADAGAVADREAAETAVFEREKTMSTGMENGIAIPHGKTDTVDRLIAALGLKPEGVDFQCVDGQPARIIIVTLSPANRTGPHIRFMAGISKLLRSERVRKRLLDASSAAEIRSVLCAAE